MGQLINLRISMVGSMGLRSILHSYFGGSLVCSGKGTLCIVIYLVLGFPFTSPILATVFLKPTLTKVIIMVVAS